MRPVRFVSFALVLAFAVFFLSVGFLVLQKPKVSKTSKPIEPLLPEPQNIVEAAEAIEETPITHAVAEMHFSTPQRLTIPSINLDATIISAGENKRREMEVPPDNKTIGWWNKGIIPGQIGSAVLAGHFKVEDGSPGVFYNLRNIKVGDEIIIADETELKRFVVLDMKMYSVEEFPLEYVFSYNDGKRRLNIMTCAGKYLPKRDDYSHRIVVYTELKV